MSDATETATATAATKTRRRGRSPAYPSFAIAKALENISALYGQEKEYAAPLASALQAFGYSPKSSGGRQALATMKYYGLIDVAGEGDDRRIKVSDVALKILRDPREDDTEKRRLIHDVALAPAAHQTLVSEYPDGLASDGTVLHFLHGQGFNEAAARELLGEYKETASTIALYEPDKELDKFTKKSDASDDKKPPKIQVGDRVQVTVAGVDLFADGATVLGFTDDEAWVYTDQSPSAAKLEEVTLLEPATDTPTAERPTVPPHLLKPKLDAAAGEEMDRFTVDEGVVKIAFPSAMSVDSLDDLDSFFKLFIKKAKRRAGADKNAS